MTPIEERVGRASHERWKLWIVESGYADHAWHPEIVPGRTGVLGAYVCGHCDKAGIEHHPDMVPWEELPEEKRGKYIGQGMAGYEIGYASGVSDGASRARRRIQHEVNQGRFPR